MSDIVLLIDRLYCIDLFSCIAASLFNKLTYLLTIYMLGKFFEWAEYISCPPSVIIGWETAHPASLVPTPLHWYRTKCTVNSKILVPPE